ncbi:TetR family transcriptional regulator [Crossiella sp. CA-258035]|uniref:TetR/AcrR family transcriptional regulator n=1 Tax=Crossiella sp. CA-258035 TaxID=2981138 RepID=UPI0024BC5F4C|nr:TetR family transcriptional regulator [Crossiella sp. CA-258035]WHT16546.1 TetR family transcriptional regulator [Crossiella sp. CA-258035]
MANAAAARGREARERLLSAAVELIPERGWAAVSTRVLAERAGVTPSVVHYHFPAVQALLREAAVGAMGQLLAGLDEVLATARTPAEAVDALVASVGEHTGTDPLSLLFVEAFLAATRDEELRREIGAVLDGFRQRLGEWLAGLGVAEPWETAAVLAATIDGLLLHRGLGAGLDTTAVLRRLVAG